MSETPRLNDELYTFIVGIQPIGLLAILPFSPADCGTIKMTPQKSTTAVSTQSVS